MTHVSLVDRDPRAASPSSLRASSYNIYIDLPQHPESFLLLHGYTGAYDRVSRGIAAYVRSLEQRHVPKPLYGSWLPEEIDSDIAVVPSQKVIDHLKKRGYLTEKSLEEEESYFVRHVSTIRRHQSRRMPTYVIMPSYDCNLRCHYCFQDFMRTDPSYNHLLKTMPPEVVLRTVKSLRDFESRYHGIEHTGEETRTFTFFGGEPLRRATHETVKMFIESARDLGKSYFSAITNATELDAYADLLGPEGIAWLQITVDGPPEEHDTRRIHTDGTGSFAQIDSNIDLALSLKTTVVIRVNVDRSSIQGLPRLAQHFVDRGWNQHPSFSCYVAPVRDSLHNGTRGDYYNSYELSVALSELQAAHPQLKCINSPDYAMKQSLLAIFEGQHDGFPQKTVFCGAHAGMYVFDPFGDIYACWERTGNENIRIGNIDAQGVATLNEYSTLWQNRDVTSNDTCRQCRFSLHCGGGCAVLAEESSGTLYSNYCDAFGKRLRSRIAEAYSDFTSGKTSTVSANMASVVEEFVR